MNFPHAAIWYAVTPDKLHGQKIVKIQDGYLVSFFSLWALQSFRAFWTLIKKYQTWTEASEDETKKQRQIYMIWSLIEYNTQTKEITSHLVLNGWVLSKVKYHDDISRD